MVGIYPARGCPFTCNFCSVIKIAGRQIRSQPVTTTIESLRAAKAAGVKVVMFTSDNFNKYPDAGELLERMIEEDLRIPFFVQCDTQIASQESFVHLLSRAVASRCSLAWNRFDGKL
jgi:anaerobic magnesium-protoporphyrin IX monomethyl ester cyclase